MQEKFIRLMGKVRYSAYSIPVTVIAAIALIGITEFAYRAQSTALENLILQGQARLRLVSAFQRLTEAESSTRGYLLTHEKSYLQPYEKAAQEVVLNLDQIDQLDAAASDPKAHELQSVIRQNMQAKLAEMREVLRFHDQGRFELALDMVRTGIGREIMQKLREDVQLLMAYRNHHISVGLDGVKEIFLMGRIGVITLTTLSTLILTTLILKSRRYEHDRELQRIALRQERDRLEQEVSDRMSDLRELTLHLQSAREDERARLARELHDELGALLTSAKLNVAFMKPKIQSQLPEVMPKMHQLVESLNAGIALKRRIIEDLSPSSLRSLGLLPALEILCSEMARNSEIDIVHQLQDIKLNADRSLTIYRFAQEALTNMAKYASATRSMVRMRREGAKVRVEVWDNGCGFDATKLPTGSHGLRGMRFRIEALGGQMAIESCAVEGTRLVAWLPLDEGAEGSPGLTAA